MAADVPLACGALSVLSVAVTVCEPVAAKVTVAVPMPVWKVGLEKLAPPSVLLRATVSAKFAIVLPYASSAVIVSVSGMLT